MKRMMLALTAVCLVAAVPAVAQVANGDGTDRWLKLHWTLEGRAISGRISNEYIQPADKVRLVVEGLDAANRVIDKRYEWVPGVVPALGNRYFEVRVVPGADHYRVAVDSYTFILSRDRF